MHLSTVLKTYQLKENLSRADLFSFQQKLIEAIDDDEYKVIVNATIIEPDVRYYITTYGVSVCMVDVYKFKLLDACLIAKDKRFLYNDETNLINGVIALIKGRRG